METNHGNIEHERRLNQGKSKKQLDDSARLYIAGVIVIIGLVIVLFLIGIRKDF